MNENRRGVFLGCFGLLLVVAFFLGLPTFIYFQFFHNQESDWSFDLSFEGTPDYLELGQEFLYFDPQEAVLYADSALAEEKSPEAYDLKLQAQAGLEDWEGILATAADVLTMESKEDQAMVFQTAPGYLPSPEADQTLDFMMEELVFIVAYDDWTTVSYDLALLNPTANIFFLEKYLAWGGEDQYVLIDLVEALQTAERYEEAIVVGNQYLTSYGEDDVMLNNVGYCYYRMGDFDQARNYFSQSAELGNESALRNLNRLKESRNK
ncbi:MAG TPA: hypothetical protein DCE41_22330 [Cytophagales bacterium]|nr:hypothetical protein [Cytophagales bacterium]HAA17263.1 hypothetical protein [Cytophagales bacterium]HAP63423.1 hypothetical protein [Cytophagales bacterium]